MKEINQPRQLSIPRKLCYTCMQRYTANHMLNDQCQYCHDEVKRRDLDDLINVMQKKYHGQLSDKGLGS